MYFTPVCSIANYTYARAHNISLLHNYTEYYHSINMLKDNEVTE